MHLCSQNKLTIVIRAAKNFRSIQGGRDIGWPSDQFQSWLRSLTCQTSKGKTKQNPLLSCDASTKHVHQINGLFPMGGYCESRPPFGGHLDKISTDTFARLKHSKHAKHTAPILFR